MAQDAAPTADDLRVLRQKIEELEREVKALKAQQTPPAQTSTSTNVEALEQKVKVLERNRELDQEAAEARAKEAPSITIGNRGFGFKSADGDFGIQLRGVLQVDSRTFFNDAGIVGNDGFLLRRARPILQGTVFRDFDFVFVPDFGGSSPQIFDAYLNYRYKPEFQLQAGKFKSPIGLEQLQADQDLMFNERALPTALVPNRDVGFMLHGDIWMVPLVTLPEFLMAWATPATATMPISKMTKPLKAVSFLSLLRKPVSAPSKALASA